MCTCLPWLLAPRTRFYLARQNRETLAEAEQLRHDTGAAAVMAASALLTNYRMFTGEEPNVWRDAWDYIEQARITPPPSIRFVKDHLLCLFGNYRSGLLKDHPDIYDLMNRNTAVTNMEQLYHLTRLLGSRYGRVLPPPLTPPSSSSSSSSSSSLAGAGSGNLVHESAQGRGDSSAGNGEEEQDPWAIKRLFSLRQIKLNNFQLADAGGAESGTPLLVADADADAGGDGGGGGGGRVDAEGGVHA